VKAEDITGVRFGRLTATERHGSRGREATWIFRCDCGVDVVRTGIRVKKDPSASCLKCRKPQHEVHGVLLSSGELAEIIGVSIQAVTKRAREGSALLAPRHSKRATYENRVIAETRK